MSCLIHEADGGGGGGSASGFATLIMLTALLVCKINY